MGVGVVEAVNGVLVLLTVGGMTVCVGLGPGIFEQPGSIVKHIPMSRMSLAFPILTFEPLGDLMVVLIVLIRVGVPV